MLGCSINHFSTNAKLMARTAFGQDNGPATQQATVRMVAIWQQNADLRPVLVEHPGDGGVQLGPARPRPQWKAQGKRCTAAAIYAEHGLSVSRFNDRIRLS